MDIVYELFIKYFLFVAAGLYVIEGIIRVLVKGELVVRYGKRLNRKEYQFDLMYSRPKAVTLFLLYRVGVGLLICFVGYILAMQAN